MVFAGGQRGREAPHDLLLAAQAERNIPVVLITRLAIEHLAGFPGRLLTTLPVEAVASGPPRP